ncbi:hypothetical protein C8R45DRAFT_833124 [Mycena sanguinolenta]|nr:hypothetical protein C8R45DRAFT_833124 [Mycena sanguinolenta]
MDAKETKDEALESLWGPVLCEYTPTHIYVEAVAAKGSKKGPSSAELFYREGSPQNSALRGPGPERLTANRARLFAIHEAVRMAPSDQGLLIFCTSKMIIRQLCYSAAKNTVLGWPGNNGDIFKSLVQLLAAHHVCTRFVYVDSKEDNQAKREAHAFAKKWSLYTGTLHLIRHQTREGGPQIQRKLRQLSFLRTLKLG